MHRLLMEGYKEIQSRIERLRSEVSAIDHERGELADDRSDALLDLAEHYLPELTRDAIESSWTEVRGSLTQILMRKEDQRRRLNEALAEINDRRLLQEDRLLQVNASLDEAKETQDRLSTAVESELAADDHFVQLSRQAAVAEAALERAEANLNEIEQDAARKLPAYEDSALFTYLRDRYYGTQDYPHRGFTRRMDRILAKYIDYPKAKKGYDFLSETPERMRKIIADDRTALDTVMGELEQRRDLVIERSGLPAALEKVTQLSEQRERRLLELDKTREETNHIERSLTDLEDTRGEHYGDAVRVFREMLSGFQSHELVAKARKTPSPTDDQIVARIQGAENRIAAIDREERKHHQQVADLQRCLDAAGRLMQRFRAAKFDASRSQFLPSVDVLDVMHRARDERDIDDLWDRLRRAQRWGPTLGEQVNSIGASPVAQVLIGAMAQAAGAALQGHVHRAGKRRHERERYRGYHRFGDNSDDSHR